MIEDTLPGNERPAVDEVGPDGLEVLTETEEPEPQEADVVPDPAPTVQELAEPVVEALPAEVVTLTPEAAAGAYPETGDPDLLHRADFPGVYDAGIGEIFFEPRLAYLDERTERGQLVINGEFRAFERVDKNLWRRTA